MKKLSWLIFSIAVLLGFTIFVPENIQAAETEPISNNFQTYTGSFTSEADVKTYNISVDFSEMDTAAICLVRTGKTNIIMTITDEEGNTETLKTSDRALRIWKNKTNPSTETDICNYTITLTPVDYDSNYSSYNFHVGDLKYVEEMTGGIENAVWLKKYTQTENNSVTLSYTPNKYESWYKFTANDTTTVTLMTYYSDIRFKIIDIDDTSIVYYDSNEDTDAHKDKYTGGYSYTEKAKLSSLTIGKDYYMVIYRASPESAIPLINNAINISVGNPKMAPKQSTFYATKSITATKSAYSTTATINAVDLPKTAVIDSVMFKTTTSGIAMSKINAWRVITPEETFWRTSTSSTITVGYKEDSNLNVPAYGMWQFSFKAATSTITLVPGIYIAYYYEVGD